MGEFWQLEPILVSEKSLLILEAECSRLVHWAPKGHTSVISEPTVLTAQNQPLKQPFFLLFSFKWSAS